MDSWSQVIVAAELSDQAPDAEQLEPALEQVADNLEAVDAELPEGATLTTDAGYFFEENSRSPPGTDWMPTSRPARFKHSEPRRIPQYPKGTSPEERDSQATDGTQADTAVFARHKAIL